MRSGREKEKESETAVSLIYYGMEVALVQMEKRSRLVGSTQELNRLVLSMLTSVVSFKYPNVDTK